MQRHVPKGVVSSISFLLCQLALQHGAAPTFVSAFDVSCAKWSRGRTAATNRAIISRRRGRIKSYSSNSASSDEEISGPSTKAAGTHASDDLLLDILSPSSEKKTDRIGPTQLAFVGDIVYELYVRC